MLKKEVTSILVGFEMNRVKAGLGDTVLICVTDYDWTCRYVAYCADQYLPPPPPPEPKTAADGKQCTCLNYTGVSLCPGQCVDWGV